MIYSERKIQSGFPEISFPAKTRVKAMGIRFTPDRKKTRTGISPDYYPTSGPLGTTTLILPGRR